MMVFGGQKSVKFVILSQTHPTMIGQQSQKIQHFGSNSQKSKKQYYGTLEKIKIKPKIRQRDKKTLQSWPKIYDFPKNIQNHPIKEVKKGKICNFVSKITLQR